MTSGSSGLDAGTIEVVGWLDGASNQTLLVTVDGTRAVYKPREGERPLWDFEHGSLAGREVAAYRLSADLGWDLVPPTVLRDGPHGPGSVQLWVDHVPDADHQSLFEADPAPFARIAVFDILINNADRKFGHVLVAPDGRLWCIDHGVSFHVEPKLRTVIWAFAGEPIPVELREGVSAWLDHGPERLCDLLQAAEVEALRGRARWVVETGRFPRTDPNYPSIPWPPW